MRHWGQIILAICSQFVGIYTHAKDTYGWLIMRVLLVPRSLHNSLRLIFRLLFQADRGTSVFRIQKLNSVVFRAISEETICKINPEAWISRKHNQRCRYFRNIVGQWRNHSQLRFALPHITLLVWNRYNDAEQKMENERNNVFGYPMHPPICWFMREWTMGSSPTTQITPIIAISPQKKERWARGEYWISVLFPILRSIWSSL